MLIGRGSSNRKANMVVNVPLYASCYTMKRKYNKEHKSWRDKVLKRDDYKCVVCGKSGKFLNAHHLIPANFKKYEFDVDNGLTLCAGCHTLGRYSAHKNPIWFSHWLCQNRTELYWIARGRFDEV